MSKGWVNLHSHSHGRLKPLPRQFDVGVEVWNFRSVRLTEVLGSRKAGTPKPIKILPPRMAVHILPDVLYPGLQVVFRGSSASAVSAVRGLMCFATQLKSSVVIFTGNPSPWPE